MNLVAQTVIGGAILAVVLGAGLRPAGAQDARRLAEVTRRQRTISVAQGADRRELSRLLGALQLFGRDPPPALLVSPADAIDAVRAVILIRALVPELQARAHTLSAEANVLADSRRGMVASESEAFAIESARAERDALPEGVIGTGSQRSTGEVRTVGDLESGAAPTRLSPPASGQVISRFGAPTSGDERSRGITISTAGGAAVHSPASGLVEFAGRIEGWRQVVILGLGGGYHVVLSGLATTVVGPGQQAPEGKVLGAMPKEAKQRPELYFELRAGGKPVDPSPLLGAVAQNVLAAAKNR